MNNADYALAIMSGVRFPFIHITVSNEPLCERWELHLKPDDFKTPVPALGQTLIVENRLGVYLGELLADILDARVARLITLFPGKKVACSMTDSDVTCLDYHAVKKRMNELREKEMRKDIVRFSFEAFEFNSSVTA